MTKKHATEMKSEQKMHDKRWKLALFFLRVSSLLPFPFSPPYWLWLASVFDCADKHILFLLCPSPSPNDFWHWQLKVVTSKETLWNRQVNKKICFIPSCTDISCLIWFVLTLIIKILSICFCYKINPQYLSLTDQSIFTLGLDNYTQWVKLVMVV